jgi:hypothetical protein
MANPHCQIPRVLAAFFFIQPLQLQKSFFNKILIKRFFVYILPIK